MTLAAILLVSVSWAPSVLPAAGAWHPIAQVTFATNGPAAAQAQETTSPAQSQPTSPQSQSTAKTPAQASSSPPGNSAPKKTAHKKKVSSPDCNSASTAAGPAASGSAAQTNTDTGAATPGAAPPTAVTNCPPSKVIVRQGGTSEPSIQLAGGTAGSQSDQRDTANQMLEATDTNLKKIGDRQLSADEQETVTQIRQFMAQSKTAIKDGNLERARTLAWKAQTLSEDLVKPTK
jgi:hypothetical protein